MISFDNLSTHIYSLELRLVDDNQTLVQKQVDAKVKKKVDKMVADMMVVDKMVDILAHTQNCIQVGIKTQKETFEVSIYDRKHLLFGKDYMVNIGTFLQSSWLNMDSRTLLYFKIFGIVLYLGGHGEQRMIFYVQDQKL